MTLGIAPEDARSDRFPLVFISHDARDSEIAEAFGKLLSSVSAGILRTFRSSDRTMNHGIEFGAEWYSTVLQNLQGATDVVCLLTRNSLDRPWILYEAGIARGIGGVKVTGVALGVPLQDALSGPFAQLQNCDDGEEALTQLVFQLVQQLPRANPQREIIRHHVREFRAAIQSYLEELSIVAPKAKSSSAKSERSSAALEYSPLYTGFPYDFINGFISSIASTERLDSLDKMYGGRYQWHAFSKWAAKTKGTPILACPVELTRVDSSFRWIRRSIGEPDWTGMFVVSNSEIIVLEYSNDDTRDFMISIFSEPEESPAEYIFGINISYERKIASHRFRTIALRRLGDNEHPKPHLMEPSDIDETCLGYLTDNGNLSFDTFTTKTGEVVRALMVHIAQHQLV